MAQTLKFGNKTWATKVGSTLAYNDENANYKPLPFAFTRSTSATRVNKEGLIEVVTSDRPRIDYTDTSDGVLLLEKAATNNILYSQKISLTPNKNGTFVDNFAISPDGTQNATKLTATTADPYFYQNVTFAAGDYTASLYVKGIGDSIGKDFRFAIGSSSHTGNKYKIPSEWTRFEFTATMGAGTQSTGLEITDPAVVGDEVLVWGWQVENNSVASSYIPTQGSAVTRVAETATDSGNSEVFNDSEGVLFADVDYLTLSAGDYFGLNDGTNNQRVLIQRQTNNIKAYINSGVELIAPISSTINKISVSYKSNNYKLYLNGFKVATNTSSSVTPSGLNAFEFELGGGIGLFAYLKTKEIGYYNTVLTDLELETLTSYKSWTSMVNELNLNIIYNG